MIASKIGIPCKVILPQFYLDAHRQCENIKNIKPLVWIHNASLSNVTRTRPSHTGLDFVRQKGGSICCACNGVCVSYKPRYLLPATQNFDPLGGRFATVYLAGISEWLQFLPTFTADSRLALVTLRTCVLPVSRPPRASSEKAANKPAVTRASSE